MLFFATSMLLQNLIAIPCIIALAVRGIKLYKSIMKDKRREKYKNRNYQTYNIFASYVSNTCNLVNNRNIFVNQFINVMQIIFIILKS